MACGETKSLHQSFFGITASKTDRIRDEAMALREQVHCCIAGKYAKQGFVKIQGMEQTMSM